MTIGYILPSTWKLHTMLAFHLTSREPAIAHRLSNLVSPFVWSAHCKIQIFSLLAKEFNNKKRPPNKSIGWLLSSFSWTLRIFFGDGPAHLSTSVQFKASRKHVTTCFVGLLKQKWRAQLKKSCEDPWTACLCNVGPLQNVAMGLTYVESDRPQLHYPRDWDEIPAER